MESQAIIVGLCWVAVGGYLVSKSANQFHQGVATLADAIKSVFKSSKNELDFRPNLWN